MDGTDQKEGEATSSGNASRPHVQIFGAEVNGRNGDAWKARKEEWKQVRQERRDECRHGHHGGLFFGLLLLFLGIAFLLNTLGLIPHGFWHAILPFWPVLLILWGLDILLGRSRFFRFIVGLIALFFFLAIMIYGLAKTASPLVKNMPPDVVNAAGNINAQNPLTQ
jgi:hypothetical protein